MYVGRIVAVGRTEDGRNAALYRVSSRSFPNRVARIEGGKGLIVPKPGFENDIHKNPYIAYCGLRIVGDVAVATNGSQTDPIAEKIASGMTIRDALASVMLALDYEKDAYDTPRVAAVVKAGALVGYLGVVRKNGLEVREVPLHPGRAVYLATYEINTIDLGRTSAFAAKSAAEGAQYAIDGGAFAALEKPVTALCALEQRGGFEVGCVTVS